MAREVGIEPATADTAVRIVLNFLYSEGPRETVERLAAEMGAGEALATPAKARGGLMGALASVMPAAARWLPSRR